MEAIPAAGLQATKSRITREKLIDSTVSLIREGGFSAASTKRIANRAGITWGAAQYHFGSKEQILQAVLNLSHERYLARVSHLDAHHGTIGERVSSLVDEMWAHYQDEIYLAAIDIVMAGRDLATDDRPMNGFERLCPDHTAMMSRIFTDSGASDHDLLEALIFAHCLLTGLTIQRTVEPDMGRLDRHIRRCKMVLQDMIAESADNHSRSLELGG